MIDPDPALVCLGDTEQDTYPLVLIFGREYNGSGSVGSYIGTYDFSLSPHSAFWNRAYGVIDRLSESCGFKTLCIKENRSPIVFSNVFPVPIPSIKPKKNELRQEIDPKVLKEHITFIFSCSILARVRLVMVSLGDGKVFNEPKRLVRAACEQVGIPFADVPYFAVQRLPNSDLDACISAETSEQIKEIVSAFLESPTCQFR
jgi:hypothetical protein